MARPTLQTITGAIDTNNSLQKINENFDAIEAGFADTLSRAGYAPNYMDNTLDMNSNRIINLRSAVNATEPITLAQAGQIAGFTSLTQAVIGSYLWPQTSEEVAAGVTPTYYYYPPGDVRRYGGVGDGVTDDTTPVLSTIQVAEQGTPGYFPKGYTFLCSTWVQATITSDTVLHGGGILKNDGTDRFIKPGGGSLWMKDLTFDTWFQVVENNAAEGTTTDKLIIENCTFLNGAAGCIDHECAVNYVYIRGCVWDTQVGHCIRIGWNDYASQDLWQRMIITENVAKNLSQTGTNDISFCLLYGKFVDVSHNYIENVVSVTGECWAIYTKTRYGTIESNRIYNMNTSGASLFAINVKGSPRSGPTTPQGYATAVRGNTLYGVNNVGAAIRLQNEDTIVANNYIEGFKIGITGSTGQAYKNQVVTGNSIVVPSTSAGFYGINLNGQVNGWVCTANSIEGGQVGIRIAAADGTCSQWLISNNRISGAVSGISHNSSTVITDVKITNNLIEGTTLDAIFVGTMDRVSIHDNEISVTSGDVLDFSGANQATTYSIRQRMELQTPDATIANIFGVQMADNTAAVCHIEALGMKSDGTDRAAYSIGGLFYRNGGGVTVQGATWSNYTAVESDATWTGPVIVGSGNDVLFRTTGKAATTINWNCRITLESVS